LKQEPAEATLRNCHGSAVGILAIPGQEDVKGDRSALKSRPGKFCAQRSVEGRAEFQDALARGFDGDREREGGGFIEKQDHTIEIAPTGAARKREADRMKEFAAPKAHEVFQHGDDLFESLRGKRNAIEQH
jgi:hypothetical protein